MGRWEELDKKRAVQSGTSAGEFGIRVNLIPDRKKFQMDYHDDWCS